MQELPPPNGLRVIGFSETIGGIQRFVETLRASERTVTGGPTLSVKKVHFSEASVVKVPRAVLMQAWTTSTRTAAGRGHVGARPFEEQNVYACEIDVESDYSVLSVTSGYARHLWEAGRSPGGADDVRRSGLLDSAMNGPMTTNGGPAATLRKVAHDNNRIWSTSWCSFRCLPRALVPPFYHEA